MFSFFHSVVFLIPYNGQCTWPGIKCNDKQKRHDLYPRDAYSFLGETDFSPITLQISEKL